MTIGGCPVRGKSFYSVVNPATGAPFGEAPECTPQQHDRTVEAAQGSFLHAAKVRGELAKSFLD
jgi:acyl-CoA reductase-like NAD-dependent aldehyde dehydrogenase